MRDTPACRVLITGANRGLGLEFARQYAAGGWSVIACCRDPSAASELQELARHFHGSLRIEPLDITRQEQIDDLATRLAETPIDVLLNNAGIMGALPFAENLQRQHFGTLDYPLWEQVLRTNTLGPLRMTEAFVEHVAASSTKKIISISSSTGSISESRRAAMAYTTSKTALNKAMTLVAETLRSRDVTVALICPGYVQTRMNVGGAQLKAEDSVRAVRQLIEGLGLEDSGGFFSYNGDSIGW